MIEERSWFGTQVQSIRKERLLPTRDSLLGIIRRRERPLNSGICEKYGSCVGSPTCLQNWLCGLAHSTVNIRNHKSLEFPEQIKGLVYELPGWRLAHERSPWITSQATCAFPISHSLPPLLLFPTFLSLSSHFGYGHLSGLKCSV